MPSGRRAPGPGLAARWGFPANLYYETAVIIVALIPLALRGVKFRALNAAAVLRRNLLIYGVGGIIAPFIGIKVIDLIINALHLV